MQRQVGGEPAERPPQLHVERRLDRDVAQPADLARPLLERKALRLDVKIERGRRLAAHHAAVDRERAPLGFHDELLENQAGAAIGDDARQPVHREIGSAALPRGVVEVEPPLDRLVVEGQRRVEGRVAARSHREREVQLIAQGDVAVDDLDRADVNRSPRAAPLFLLRVAPDQRGKVPAAIRLPGRDHARPLDANAGDGRAAIHQLTDAVADGHPIDGDDRLAVAGEADVRQLDAANQRTLERADFERRGEVLVGLPDDQAAKIALRPTGLHGAERGSDQQEDGGDSDGHPFDQTARDAMRSGAVHEQALTAAGSGAARGPGGDRSRAAS